MLLLYENDNGHIKYHQNLSVVDGLKINTCIYIYSITHSIIQNTGPFSRYTGIMGNIIFNNPIKNK